MWPTGGLLHWELCFWWSDFMQERTLENEWTANHIGGGLWLFSVQTHVWAIYWKWRLPSLFVKITLYKVTPDGKTVSTPGRSQGPPGVTPFCSHRDNRWRRAQVHLNGNLWWWTNNDHNSHQIQTAGYGRLYDGILATIPRGGHK